MEVSKGLEMDQLKVTCEKLRNERDVLTLRVQHLLEEKNGKGKEIEEKIKEILLDELTDIAKEMKTEKKEQTEDGYIVINTPISRLHTVAVIYNTIWQAGGNRIAYPTCV